MSSFSMEASSEAPNRRRIAVRGVLNEDARLPAIDFTGVDEVVFDFLELKGMNSVGIRSWIYWVPAVPAARMVNCPYFLVQQFTMVKGLLPDRFRVDSILLPVLCESCDREAKVLLDLNKLRHDSKSPFDAHAFVRAQACDSKPCDVEADFFEQTVEKFVRSQLGTSSFPGR